MTVELADYTFGDYKRDRDEERYDQAQMEFLKERLGDEKEELLEDDVIYDRLLEIYADDLSELYLEIADS